MKQVTTLLQNIQHAINPNSVFVSKFKQRYSPLQRRQKYHIIKKDDPKIIPVVLEILKTSSLFFKSNNQSKLSQPFLLFGIDSSVTLFQLRQKIMPLLVSKGQQSIVMLCAGLLPQLNQRVSTLENYKQPDGFIYLYLSQHQSFGGILQKKASELQINIIK